MTKSTCLNAATNPFLVVIQEVFSLWGFSLILSGGILFSNLEGGVKEKLLTGIITGNFTLLGSRMGQLHAKDSEDEYNHLVSRALDATPSRNIGGSPVLAPQGSTTDGNSLTQNAKGEITEGSQAVSDELFFP